MFLHEYCPDACTCRRRSPLDERRMIDRISRGKQRMAHYRNIATYDDINIEEQSLSENPLFMILKRVRQEVEAFTDDDDRGGSQERE